VDFVIAMAENSTRAARLLLDKGVSDIDLHDALRCALNDGQEEFVELFLGYCSDQTKFWSHDGALIDTTVKSGNVNVVRMLIEAGADVNRTFTPVCGNPLY
jgi:ankyrin repeat protein